MGGASTKSNHPFVEGPVHAPTGSTRKPQINCKDCRHRTGVGFVDLDQGQLAYVSALKQSHGVAWAGETIIDQGEPSDLVGTLYSGLAIRYRTLPTGKRLLLMVLMPGDLFGLESMYRPNAPHSITAVTDVTFCVFAPERWRDIYKHPGVAERLSQVQLLQQRQLEDRFAAVAACSARQSVAHFVLELYDGLKRRRLVRDHSFALPLTNRQFADALGLTTVHLHRVLREMRREDIFSHKDHRIHIHNLERLRALTGLGPPADEPRPLI